MSATHHKDPLDKNGDSYKAVVQNGRIVTEFRVPTLHGNDEVRVIRVQGAHTKGKKNLPAYISIHGGANIGG